MVLVFMLICALAFTPSVHAYSIDKLSVDWNGNEVKTISPSATLSGARLALKLTPDFADCFDAAKYRSKVCAVTIDASSLTRDPATKTALKTLVFGIRDACVKQADNTYLCKSVPFKFSTASTANKVSVDIKVDAQRLKQDFTVPIVIDTTNPSMASLRTRFCDADQCYATSDPTPFTVTFSDSMTAFDYRLVFVGAQGLSGVATVSNCTGTRCEGVIPLPCSASGQEFEITLTSAQGVSSREDALNPADIGVSQRVVCALKAPTLLEWKAAVADGIPTQSSPSIVLAASGKSVTFQAKVRSYAGAAYATVNSSNISTRDMTAATCTVASDETDKSIYTCSWQISSLLAGRKELEFVMTDAVGNAVRKQLTLHVLNTTTPGNKSLDLFTVIPKEFLPKNGVNRIALDLAANNYLPYPAYLTYEFKANKGKPKVLHQELKQCWYRLPNETNYSTSGSYNLFSRDRGESRVLYPAQDHTKLNRLNLQIRAPADVLAKSDVFIITCQIDLTVMDGEKLYAEAEHENVTFNLTLREARLGQPGAVFVDKIQAEEKRLNGSASKALMTLRKVRATLDGICTIMESLQGLSSTGSSIGAAGTSVYSVPVYGQAVGGFLQGLGFGAIQKPIEEVLKNVWEDPKAPAGEKSEKFIKKVCKQVNCRGIADFNNNGGTTQGMLGGLTGASNNFGSSIQGSVGGSAAGMSSTNVGEFAGSYLANNINAFDYRNSFIMSALHLCVGGMVYNAGKWQDINCGYLQCLKEQSLQAGSVSVCEQGKSHKLCTQVVGEVFELPFVNVIKNLASNIDGIVQNLPGIIGKFIFNQACQGKLEQPPQGVDWQGTVCHVGKAAMNIVDYSQQTVQMMNAPMSDDTICLQALCNDKDPSKCKRSYNAAEKWTEYTKYLSVNNWIKNEQKRSATTQKESEDVANLFGELGDGRTVVGAIGNTGSTPETANVALYVYNADRTPNNELGARVENYCRERGITFNQFSELYNKASFIEAGKQGIVIKNEAELNAYTAQKDSIVARNLPLGTSPSDIKKMNLAADIVAAENACKAPTCNSPKYPDGIKKENGKYVCTQQSTNCGLGEGLSVAELTTSAGQWTAANARLLGGAAQATAVRNYERCITSTPKCNAQEIDALKKALESNNIFVSQDGKYSIMVPGGESKAASVVGASCAAGTTCTSGDKTYYCKSTTECFPVATLSSTEAGNAAGAIKTANFYAAFDLIAGIAAQWAYDQGYLDWLSISSYGEWGRDASDFSKQYISPEGWKQNICNDLVVDIQDNDEGAIYEPSDGARTNIVGTFGAEIREIENETGKSYVYIYTVMVTNPQRPYSAAHRQGDKLYDFKLDMSLRDPLQESCLIDSCTTGDFDMVNGTFNLTEGVNFGSGTSPKKGVLYLPVKYQRLCITFDKPFPSSTFGKKTYCRDIKENTFNTGSPVAGQATGRYASPASAGTGVDTGDGRVAGEV
ncbi:TPA: hypothetical protein HA251_04935 [Candidatus Woesearchaeota archaeon]|nr:hypothetical protein [Candidatus Woesearchaeota archaeon]